LLLERRAAGTPTQYLTGRQEFWGLTFQVEPGVFIPRPETEHVVEAALAIVRERLKKPNARIVDVGTGTGCIALALASELPAAEIFATDISEAALAVARRNAETLSLASRVSFLHADLLDAFLTSRGSFDLIVSNPPYVSPDDAPQLPREVLEHEPAEALFSPGEGLAITRRLIVQAAQLLVPSPVTSHQPALSEVEGSPVTSSQSSVGGWLVIELGYQMSSRVQSLLGAGWGNVEITPDLRGIPRVLSAQAMGHAGLSSERSRL
jgi:release factor glutamine methyltransferase